MLTDFCACTGCAILPDSRAAPASTRVRGCTQPHEQSCGACLERFFEPLTGAAAPAWELLRRQTCPKWTCCTTPWSVSRHASGASKKVRRRAVRTPYVRAPSRAPQLARSTSGSLAASAAGCEAHAPARDTRFGVQGARARRVAHRAWPRTSVWYLLAPHSPHTRPHRLPPPSGRSPSGCSGAPQRSEARRARGGRASRGRAGNGPEGSPGGLGGAWAAARGRHLAPPPPATPRSASRARRGNLDFGPRFARRPTCRGNRGLVWNSLSALCKHNSGRSLQPLGARLL